jgi:benzoate/toluate 1,2-dioxygenase subunit alpha
VKKSCGFESQIPKPHDFFTGWIGRQPVLVSRDKDGTLGALLNTCRHRGALVAHNASGNAKYHVCHYHGWAYDSGGRILDIKDGQHGCYAPSFDRDSHDLQPVARFGNYRGLLFGSLNPEVPALEQHLGDTRALLDLVLDQGEQGVELIPGMATYTFKANWKLQVENCVDLYHLTSCHPSFMQIVERRNKGDSGNALKAIDFADYRLPGMVRGSYTFPYGHAMVWGGTANPAVRPLYADAQRLRERVGETRMKWMFATRNLTIYPNVQFAENASLQVRMIRPLSVDRTEMRIACLGPVGEQPEAREYRIRQFEDFFNSTGMATPDDTTSYEDCQVGYRAYGVSWQQGYARGMTAVRQGGDEYSEQLGIHPQTSVLGPFDIQDETVFHSGYREWLRLMKAGQARSGAGS